MAQPDQDPALIRNRLLAALPPQDLARLLPELKPVGLVLNETLYRAGGIIEAVLFPEEGMVSLIATFKNGAQVEVGIAGSEGLVGLPLVLGDDVSLVEARVQMAGTALGIGAAAFRTEMAHSTALRTLLMRYALAFHAQVTLTAACNARHSIERRFARWLLIAHDRAKADELPMTQEFISAMLGVHRPGVTLAARVLQTAGLIRYTRGQLVIMDRPGLEAAACECYGVTQREFARLLAPSAAQP